MTEEERVLLEQRDRALLDSQVVARLDAVVDGVARNLTANPDACMAWESIPLDECGEALPQAIQSSWVFILRAGRATGAERHPNSVQRMVSYRGAGDLQTGDGQPWESHLMVSDGNAAFEQRWLSIPINTWHQAVVTANDDWAVVSFHSAPAEELIEERPDPGTEERMHQRRYVEETRQSW